MLCVVAKSSWTEVQYPGASRPLGGHAALVPLRQMTLARLLGSHRAPPRSRVGTFVAATGSSRRQNFCYGWTYREVGATHVDSRVDKLIGYQRFAECGFSQRTTAVLIKAGIDAPERLLSMPPEQIRLLHGIGPTLMKEVEQYRAQFEQ